MNALTEKILSLKKERNAVILAHNYVLPEIQDIADFVGDSLELSIKARDLKAELIVFCGVSFMAETAKLLSPASKVLLPVENAGCAMADMVDPAELARFRADHPDTVLIAYVNTTAETKALVDICCTSANAEKVVASIPKEKEIMFLPDRNLGTNVSGSTGRKMDLWRGFCPIHNKIAAETSLQVKAAHPGVPVLVHPECPAEVVAVCEHALSTGGMLRFVKNSGEKEFIVATEYGIIHRLKKENPEKIFHALDPLPTCEDMKKIKLEDVANCLQNLSGEVKLDPEIMERARLPIDRMLDLQ